jgi:hypothetical protein
VYVSTNFPESNKQTSFKWQNDGSVLAHPALCVREQTTSILIFHTSPTNPADHFPDKMDHVERSDLFREDPASVERRRRKPQVSIVTTPVLYYKFDLDLRSDYDVEVGPHSSGLKVDIFPNSRMLGEPQWGSWVM